MIPFDPERRARRTRGDQTAPPTASSAPDPFLMPWSAIKRRFETGTATRGRSLQERGAVHDLARTPDGGLVARVRADQQHVVNVGVVAGGVVAGVVSADCTCADELDCRHAVAVLLEYQAQVTRGVPVPAASNNDPRITGAEQRQLLGDLDEEEEDEDDDFPVPGPGASLVPPWLFDTDDDDDLDDSDDEDDLAAVRLVLPDDVRQYLRGLPSEALAELLEQVASTRHDVYDQIVDSFKNQHASTDELIEAARLAIEDLEAPSTYNTIFDITQDLERLSARLQALVDRGRADNVLELYRELLLESTAMIRALDEDDPEDAVEIEPLHEQLQVPFEALPAALDRSSLGPAARLLWLTELHKTDPENLVGDATFPYWSQERPAEVWSEVADGIVALLDRDRPAPVPDDDASPPGTWREIAIQQLAHALNAAGRDGELTRLLERQAEQSGDMTILASHLIEIGDLEGAERRLRQAIEEEASPILLGLSLHREMLGQVYERRGDPHLLAAFYADRFFRLPTLIAYQPLIETARSIGVDEPVRRHALRYLETLQLPWSIQHRRNEAELPSWPLLDLELPEPKPVIPQKAPLADLLLEILLEESDVDEALRWYERARGTSLSLEDEVGILERIALLLEPSRPDRAVSLLLDRARYFLDRGRPGLIEDAAIMLERAGRIEQRRGRLAAWLQTVSGLRHRHRKQTRVRQILDDVLAQFPSA